MKLRCIQNTVIAAGPRYNNESDLDMTIYLPLRIGATYEGQFVYGEILLRGEYGGCEVWPKTAFVCYDENLEWNAYDPKCFEPMPE